MAVPAGLVLTDSARALQRGLALREQGGRQARGGNGRRVGVDLEVARSRAGGVDLAGLVELRGGHVEGGQGLDAGERLAGRGRGGRGLDLRLRLRRLCTAAARGQRGCGQARHERGQPREGNRGGEAMLGQGRSFGAEASADGIEGRQSWRARRHDRHAITPDLPGVDKQLSGHEVTWRLPGAVAVDVRRKRSCGGDWLLQSSECDESGVLNALYGVLGRILAIPRHAVRLSPHRIPWSPRIDHARKRSPPARRDFLHAGTVENSRGRECAPYVATSRTDACQRASSG